MNVVLFLLTVSLVIDELTAFRLEADGRLKLNGKSKSLKVTNWMEERNALTARLAHKDPLSLNRNYLYVNIWTSWCLPCVREMPWLDSLAGTIDKDVNFLFVTDMQEYQVISFLEKRNMKIKNFIMLNNMGKLITAICRKNEEKSMIYPLELIIDRRGRLLFSSHGAYESAADARHFIKLVNELN